MIIYVYILICAYTVNQLVGLIVSNSQFSSFKSHVVLLNSQFPFFFSNVDQNSQFSPIANNIVQSSFSIIFPTPVAFPLSPCCPLLPPVVPPGTAVPALGGALPRWATPWRCCWASWPSRPRASRSWSFGARWAPAVEPCARGCRPWSRRQGPGARDGLWAVMGYTSAI